MGSPSFIGASSVVPPRLLCPPRRFENTAFKNFDHPSRGGIEAPLEVGSWVQGLNWRGFPSRMLKKSLFSPTHPWRAETRLSPGSVLASFRPKRISEVG